MNSEHWVTAVVSIILAVIGLAVVALLVSPSSATAGVFSTSGQSIAGLISCALSPVRGGGCSSGIQVSLGGSPLPGGTSVPCRGFGFTSNCT
jgi:hypothetical protein